MPTSRLRGAFLPFYFLDPMRFRAECVLSVTIRVFLVEPGATALRATVSKAQEGVMKRSKSKKQPSRHEYALALKTIRAQFQTIESQSDTIRRQNQFMITIWMDDEGPANHGKSHDKAWQGSTGRWIN
jgi:hypothetical protein